jgi:hypothetical protein
MTDELGVQIEKLQFEGPGDICFIRVDRVLTPKQVDRIREQVRRALPPDVKAIVAEPGLTIEAVIRQELEEESQA